MSGLESGWLSLFPFFFFSFERFFRIGHETKNDQKTMTFEESLERQFDLSRVKSPVAQVDYWLTLVAFIACIETIGVCFLAVWRYSRKVYNVVLQRWTMRIILVGPIYSCLMWWSLWQTHLDFFIAIPVGFYEAYAFYCFYALLVCFADGEDRLVTAFRMTEPTALLYHPFGNLFCSRSTTTTRRHPSATRSREALFGGRVRGIKTCVKFKTARELVKFLRRSVAQAMVVKPLNTVAMLLFSHYGYANYANYSRMASILSLWLVANSLTQTYHVILPRIRGLGGEKLFMVLILTIFVVGTQDVVCSALLINSGTSSATESFPTRLIFIFTILEFTAFSTIFYRLLPPEKFAQMNWTNSINANISSVVSLLLFHNSHFSQDATITAENHVHLFLSMDHRRSHHHLRHSKRASVSLLNVLSFRLFSRYRQPSFSDFGGIQCGINDIYDNFGGVKESKRDDDDDVLYDETSPLVK